MSSRETDSRGRVKHRPAVSVVMPVFNLEEAFPCAVESVLCQTMADFELIVVDDASTDSTLRIAEYYCFLDSRVRVVRNNTNSRRAAIEWEPRNNGLQIARGEFVAYLDGDNAWQPGFLGALAEVLRRSSETQLVYCRSKNYHVPEDIDTVIAGDSRDLRERGTDWVVFAQDDLDPKELGRSQYVDANEMMHRATVFDRLGSLWHTTHPRRDWVNKHQGKRCAYRRHNDLDLVERIIEEFGVAAVSQVPEVLVDFYYRGALRNPRLVEISSMGSPLVEEVAS